MQTLPKNLRTLIRNNEAKVRTALTALREAHCYEVRFVDRTGRVIVLRRARYR